MSIDERTRRMAAAAKLPFGEAVGDSPALMVNRGFVFDPPWLRHHAANPGAVLTIGGVPVIAHVRNAAEREAVAQAMATGTPFGVRGTLAVTAYEDGAEIVNEALRKRERPFAMPLRPDTVKAAERASYFGAYKGVTDLLTKYLWPEWALVLTRIAARIGMTPNMVTGIGAALCVAATIAFWHGHYWLGMAMGLVFMVLDTVDGKLARCTITSSWWGNIFDHGIDLVHPPFWWWAWGVGLTAYGRPLPQGELWLLLAVIVGVYILQRFVEGAFMRLYGMHIHVWRKVDSQFRLITARRNPNMVILFVAMLFQRPDIGLIVVAWWTVISFVVHGVQLVQAMVARARGREIASWLA
ncbi:CDP-alcohol phosphatidyltransferase family protein [Sphingomonas sp. DBB INV C78]|uniref:CDP-alcohol phosphatidyltransferase family protein n=1 Tax=Sphingomonas sp. DBB INV C78 TaxID=3349434 RepID=UPI0036D3863B